VSASVYWCDTCGAPLLQPQCGNCGKTGWRVASDLKPMFEDERRFLATCTGDSALLELPLPFLWMRQRTIYYHGRRYAHLAADGKPILVKSYDSKTPPLPDPLPTTTTLLEANRAALAALEDEAIAFIRQVAAEHPRRLPVVSFSGGKDSVVVSHLVRRALGYDEILHVFGDTTIEYPDTYDFIQEFQKQHPHIPFQQPRAPHDWFAMCEVLDPPSRILRWCCTVFKASPIGTVINAINGSNGVLNFEGLRRSESNRRRKAQRVYASKKIVRQLSVEPILDWPELAVWLYIKTQGLAYNRAYEHGFSRVGCMYCPYNVLSSEYLMNSEHLADERYREKVRPWVEYLESYATRIGKSDPEEYVTSGAWKARAGVNEGATSATLLSRHPGVCGGEVENEYILTIPATKRLYDLFQPLGVLSPMSDETLGFYLVSEYAGRDEQGKPRKGKPLFQFQAIPGWKRLRVTLLVSKGRTLLRQRIEKQIKKFQACVECGGCVGVCPQTAISMASPLAIDDTKCIRCGRCYSTKVLKYGCVALNSNQQSRKYSTER